MLRRVVTFSFILTSLLVTASAQASERYRYIGADLMALNYDGPSTSAQPSMLAGRFGYFEMKNFGVEARLGTSLIDDELSGMSADLEADKFAGIYGVARIPLGNVIDIYGLIGRSRVTLTATSSTTSVSSDYEGTTFGLGVTFHLGEHWEVRGEYSSIFDDADESLAGAILNLGYAF